MTDGVFTEAATPAAEVAKNTVTDSSLSALVGEGKKFSDVEQLAKGKLEADNFIEKLKAENAELKAVASKVNSLEEVISTLKAETQKEKQTTSSVETPDIAKLVDERLSTIRAKETAETNVGMVSDHLTTHFGDKVKEVVAAKAKELGVGVSFLEDIAAKSPTACLAMFGVAGSTLVGSNPNPVAGAPKVNAPVSSTGTKTRVAELEELRTKNPNKFFSPRIQLEYYNLKEQSYKEGKS